MAFDSTLSSKLEEREKENAQSIDCLRLAGERKDGRPNWISGGESWGVGEFDQLFLEHHLRDDQAENVSFSLVTMELKPMAVTSMFLW